MAMNTAQALAKASSLYETLRNRRRAIQKNEDYASGKQPLVFATEEWKKSHESRYVGFADNWCGVVASAPAERTRIDGFRLPGNDGDALSREERDLWYDWEVNAGPAQSSQGFQTSTVSRRSYSLVWGDRNDEPLLSWEHPSQVLVEYDVESRRHALFAIKAWADDEFEYLSLYTPNELYKWKRPAWRADGKKKGVTDSGIILPSTLATSGGWEPRQEASDDTWPVRHPMKRVPVVEWPNRPTLAGGPVSDIEGTMAMQDAINMLWAYLFAAADYASMPARIVTGAQPPTIPILDDKGNVIGDRPLDIDALQRGRMLWITGEGKPHQWDAAKLDVFTDVVNVQVKHVATQTKTPIYLIHGELGNVNGETLTGLDAPLVSKVTDAQVFYKSSARETFALMAMARGNEDVARAAMMGGVKWRNATLVSESQIADAAVKARAVGLPLQYVLESVYGLTAPEVDRVMAMVRDEQMDPYLALTDDKEAAASPVQD